MLGYVPRCLFMVFARPSDDRVLELQEWYDVIHAPDAMANGSFNALTRYQCVNDRTAPFLALWEGEWVDDKDAWDYIRPRAEQLHSEGRIGDIPSAEWASMTFTGEPGCAPVANRPARTLTMVQSDWYHPDVDRSLADWLGSSGVGADDAGAATWHSRYFYSADRTVEPGLHVAFFESDAPVGVVTAAWKGFGTLGPSPTRPFKGLFEERGEGRPVPPKASAYVSHWAQIARLG